METPTNPCENSPQTDHLLNSVLYYSAIKNKQYGAAIKILEIKENKRKSTSQKANTALLKNAPTSFTQEWQNPYKYERLYRDIYNKCYKVFVFTSRLHL